MSAITYKDCLWTLVRNSGRNPNPAASVNGIGDITNLDRDQYTSFLNDAIIRIWSLDEFSIWPWTAAVVTPTITTNTFQYSAINYAEYWTAWRVDPRTSFKSNTNTDPYPVNDVERLRLGSALDVDGATILLHPQNSDYNNLTDPVTVFYRIQPPQWTWTPVVAATTYALNDLVYDDASGNVYKSLGAYLGSAISDITKWTPQTIPSQLRQLVLADAERRRLIAQNPAQSEQALQECMMVIERETEKAQGLAEQTIKASPWLRRSYEDPNQRNYSYR
jgi:hypothetical protein